MTHPLERSFADATVLTTLPQPPLKTLLVNDDEVAAAHLRHMIEAAGFEVASVDSGAAALAHLDMDGNFASVVFMDRSVPGIDDFEAWRAIRAGAHSERVYVILLTGEDEEQDILNGFEAGADDYLSKRPSTAQLAARLRAAQRILSLQSTVRDLTQERERLAMTDALTGANNFRYFLQHGEREVSRALRFNGTLSVLALDIDHFKPINERFGRSTGDEALMEFSRRLQQAIPRAIDWCARLGGGEFAVVLPETDLAGARVVAERVRQAIASRPFRCKNATLAVTVSIGVGGMETIANRQRAKLEMLLSSANQALKKSKSAGRNCVSVARTYTRQEG